jgi:hypothetical protein
MFLELGGIANQDVEEDKMQSTFEYELINELRSRYGLKICEVECLDNLFDGVLEVKIENEMHALEEGEFIEEEEDNFIESSELKEGEEDESKMKFDEENEDYRCEEEYESGDIEEEDEDFDELITEEMNQRAKTRKKKGNEDDDDIVFE